MNVNKKPYKKLIVKFKKQLKSANDATNTFQLAQQGIAKAASKHVIHKNKRNRLIARLQLKLNQQQN